MENLKGITKKVTTTRLKYSITTILKNSDESVEYISNALGHNDVNTTKRYLDSFELEEKDDTSHLHKNK